MATFFTFCSLPSAIYLLFFTFCHLSSSHLILVIYFLSFKFHSFYFLLLVSVLKFLRNIYSFDLIKFYIHCCYMFYSTLIWKEAPKYTIGHNNWNKNKIQEPIFFKCKKRTRAWKIALKKRKKSLFQKKKKKETALALKQD